MPLSFIEFSLKVTERSLSLILLKKYFTQKGNRIIKAAVMLIKNI
jgi:hypothetical protein